MLIYSRHASALGHALDSSFSCPRHIILESDKKEESALVIGADSGLVANACAV